MELQMLRGRLEEIANALEYGDPNYHRAVRMLDLVLDQQGFYD